MRQTATKVTFGILGAAGILLLWIAGSVLIHSTRTDLPPNVVSQLYPSPQQVVNAAFELPIKETLDNAGLSIFRVLAGFSLASLIAIPLGFGIGRIRFMAYAIEPINDFLRYLPVAGFTTLAIFLIGTGNSSAILVVFLGTVFHLTVAVADAARRIPVAYIDLAQTINLTPNERIWKILVPAALPTVFDSLRISIGWAWSYVTLAEIMGTSGGLGYAIELARRYIRTDQVLVYMILIGLLGLISDQVMRAIGLRAFRWSRSRSAM
jgi:NitT/TauT family transport system permease protein